MSAFFLNVTRDDSPPLPGKVGSGEIRSFIPSPLAFLGLGQEEKERPLSFSTRKEERGIFPPLSPFLLYFMGKAFTERGKSKGERTKEDRPFAPVPILHLSPSPPFNKRIKRSTKGDFFS